MLHVSIASYDETGCSDNDPAVIDSFIPTVRQVGHESIIFQLSGQ